MAKTHSPPEKKSGLGSMLNKLNNLGTNSGNQSGQNDIIRDLEQKALKRLLIWLAPSAGGLFVGVLLLIVFVAAITGAAISATGGVGFGSVPPGGVDPSKGIPKVYVSWIQKASQIYRVPMQFIAGDIMEESYPKWDPMSYADYDGSHAAGLMQFEPGTWSGSLDPDQTLAMPDTNANRIKEYMGYGVDADGMKAPDGTPANISVQQLQQLNAQCSSSSCVPYASPFDPFDAIYGGAYYWSDLDREFGDWSNAAVSYSGDTPGYFTQMEGYVYEYIADTSPMKLKSGNGYWLFGNALIQTNESGNSEKLSANVTGQYPLANEFIPSLPIVAPTDGVVTWITHPNGKVTILLPSPQGGEISVQGTAIRWNTNTLNSQSTVDEPAGEVVGFLDFTKPVTVSPPLEQIYGINSGSNIIKPSSFATSVYGQ